MWDYLILSTVINNPIKWGAKWRKIRVFVFFLLLHLHLEDADGMQSKSWFAQCYCRRHFCGHPVKGDAINFRLLTNDGVVRPSWLMTRVHYLSINAIFDGFFFFLPVSSLIILLSQHQKFVKISTELWSARADYWKTNSFRKGVKGLGLPRTLLLDRAR